MPASELAPSTPGTDSNTLNMYSTPGSSPVITARPGSLCIWKLAPVLRLIVRTQWLTARVAGPQVNTTSPTFFPGCAVRSMGTGRSRSSKGSVQSLRRVQEVAAAPASSAGSNASITANRYAAPGSSPVITAWPGFASVHLPPVPLILTDLTQAVAAWSDERQVNMAMP